MYTATESQVFRYEYILSLLGNTSVMKFVHAPSSDMHVQAILKPLECFMLHMELADCLQIYLKHTAVALYYYREKEGPV